MWNLVKIMSGHNPIVALSLSVPIFLCAWFLNAINFLILSRIFFALGMGQAYTKAVRGTSVTRWHTPTVALGVTLVCGIFSFFLQTWESGMPWIINMLAAVIGGLLSVFAISMLMAAVVPYKTRSSMKRRR